MHKITPLTDDEILKLSIPNIRYALYSYKLGTMTGNTKPIIAYYLPRLIAYNLDRSDFAGTDGLGWDIDKKDPRNIVSGHIVRKYNEVLNASLFNEDGTLKD